MKEKLNIFQKNLLNWYTSNQRILPWRERPSIYKTVISEFMLQQTQVKTVIPYFNKWIKKFPNFSTLASSNIDTIMKYWEGLGYYNRVRNLHQVAIHINKKGTPKTFEGWKALKGIGDYTASAISSISQNACSSLVDGNVVRILARIYEVKNTFKNNNEAVKFFKPYSESIIYKKNPGDWNQALMELGATICTKNNPHCNQCPVSKFCISFKNKSQNILPKIKRKKIIKSTIQRAFLIKDKGILLYKNSSNAKRLQDQHELPLLKDLDLNTKDRNIVLTKTRSISNQRIKEEIYLIEEYNKKLNRKKYPFIVRNKINSIIMSGPHRRWVKMLLEKY